MTQATEFEQVEYGYDERRECAVTFKGKEVGYGETRDGGITAYLTPGGQIRTADPEGVSDPEDFEVFAAAWGKDQPGMVYQAAQAIGRKFTVDLDA